MVGHLRLSGRAFTRAATPFLLCMGLSVGTLSLTHAAQPGHGRVNSIAGAPLEVSVPVTGLTADDLKVLKASVAEPSAWAQAGLTLPAAMESMSVSVEPGLNASSRSIVLRSTQAVDRPVIDVLIRLTTASGTTAIQSSYLVLTSDLAAGAAGSVQVERGDTLYAIAMSRAVPGADVYQVMWAIYEANPQAFISENMNLLRAGATLRIPDAATIRRVDPKYARAMFAKHDGVFKARRGGGVAPVGRVQTVGAATTDSGKVTPATEAPRQSQSVDQVRLASNSPADQQSDARVATSNALSEMQSRVEALQKNVEELKEALQKSQAASGQAAISGMPGAAGAPGASGSPGTPGVAGAAGAPGVAGATGAAGATGGSSASGSRSATEEGVGSKTTGVSSIAGAPGAAGPAAVSGGSHGDKSAAGQSPAQGTDMAAAKEAKHLFIQVKEYASDHVLGLVLGISGLLALLIALLLRRAGRQDPKESLEEAPRSNPALASAFDQKLQSIDLNLDSEAPTVGNQSDAPKTKA